MGRPILACRCVIDQSEGFSVGGDEAATGHAGVVGKELTSPLCLVSNGAVRISAEGTKIAMFMRLQFLEGQSRKDLFETTPPKKVYVSTSRLLCAKNGQFDTEEESSSVAYAWFIWEKGYDGPTTIDWFN